MHLLTLRFTRRIVGGGPYNLDVGDKIEVIEETTVADAV